MSRAANTPPIGARFERIVPRKGREAARRVYELTQSAPAEPDMAGEHTLVCVVDVDCMSRVSSVGSEIVVEDAWFTYRTDFKQVQS